MAIDYTVSISDDEQSSARERVKPYVKFISDNPLLTSMLYDIDLLPEQIRMNVNATRMIAVCELFKIAGAEAVKAALNPGSN